MKEGKAVRKEEISDIWEALEKRIRSAGIKDAYDYLASLSKKEQIRIGIKRGLMGGLTGDYIWFLIPLPARNAVAMEAAQISGEVAEGEEGKGRATYFFRITGRKEFNGRAEPDRAVDGINRGLVEINFRREPVYLPDERLEEPRYQKYRFSIAKLPGLRFLREAFIGRVVHADPEQWKKNVVELLEFNVKAKSDREKWIKEDEACQDTNNPAGTAAS